MISGSRYGFARVWGGGRLSHWSIALDTQTLSQRIAAIAVDRKALDVTILDIRGRSSYADFLVIASGTSDRHVQAIAEVVMGTLSKEGTRCLGREGLREGQWALIDFGSVVLHVFHEFTRSSFDLEALWKTAPKRLAEGTERSDGMPQAPRPTDAMAEEPHDLV